MAFLGKLFRSPLVALNRVAALFSRRRLDEELREEMEGHIQLRRQALIDSGMDPHDADAAARRLFGNATALRERTREMWGFPAVDSVLQDLRYGARVLRRSPMFTVVAVLSIAGGLAAGTGIFAVMNAVVFRPLGMGDGKNVYRIYTSDQDGGSLYQNSSYADYESFRQTTSVLASTCATEGVLANLLVNGTAQLHSGDIVSPGCFEALKLTPELGQFFSAAQATESAVAMPIVISHSLWVRRFASDRSIVGRTILLNGMSVAVVAVAGQGFAGTSLDGGADFWAPIHVAPVVFQPGILRDRGQRRFAIYARLRDGVGREQAEARLAVVAAQLRRLDPLAWTTTRGATRKVTVMREKDARFAQSPEEVAGIVAGLMAAVGVIVGIACLNLATMLLARGASRSRELSIRLAIGASRARVLRQMATESLIIGSLGAAAAILIVAMALRLFNAYRPAVIPAFDVAIDWHVLTFAIGTAAVAVLLFGLAPATHTLRLALAQGLKGHPPVARARRIRVGARDALIVVQVAVSIALLLVSTLFVRGMADGATLSPGFNVAGVVIVSAHLDAVADSEVATVTAKLLQAAKSVPNVEDVSLAHMIPLMGSSTGFDVSVNGSPGRTYFGDVISPGYFTTLQIPLRAGRDFDLRDGKGGAPAAIVSETFARSAWGTTQAVGRAVVVDSQRVEVVGVVADTRYRGVREPFLPLIYLPIAQKRARNFVIHARVSGGAGTLVGLNAAIRATDRRVAIQSATDLRSQIDEAMAPERAAQWIAGVVGILQLGLAVMALWGLVAYAVERRTTEMGIRLALGATPASLVRLTMRPAGVLIVVGVAIGTVVGAAAATVMQSESVGLPPLDLVAVIPLSGMFMIVAMAAAWWPARRAGMADPAASLRRE